MALLIALVLGLPTCRVQKRHVWVEEPPPRRLLVRLVRASVAVKR